MDDYSVSKILFWVANYMEVNNITFRLRYYGKFEEVTEEQAFACFSFANFLNEPIICLN